MLRASYSIDNNNQKTPSQVVFPATDGLQNLCCKEKGGSMEKVSTELFKIQRLYHTGELTANKAFDRVNSIVSDLVSFEAILFGRLHADKVDRFIYFCSGTNDRSDLEYWNDVKNATNKLLCKNVDALNSGLMVSGKSTFGKMTEDVAEAKKYLMIPTLMDNESLGFLALVNVEEVHLEKCEGPLRELTVAFALIYLFELRMAGSGATVNGKSKNELLDMLVKHSSDMIGVFDVNWMPKYLSPSFEQAFGFTRNQLMDPSFFEGFRSKVKDMEKVVVDGVKRYRFTNLNSAGERIWLESIFDTLYDEDGEIQGHMAIMRNISEEVIGEQKMSEALEKEIALNKMKSQFISITSHEFKTPLSTIKSSIEICNIELQRQLQEHPSEQKFKKHFNRVNNEVDRMNSLLVNLLNLEKINQGVIQVSSKGKKINSYLRSVLED